MALGSGRMRRIGLLAGVLSACGTNVPEIPDSLLDAGSSDAACRANYPTEGVGTEEGDVVADLGFSGWRDPTDANVDVPLGDIRFSDYYDPEQIHGHELLLLNVSAVWCAACQDEYEYLPAYVEAARDRGLVAIGLLFQDAVGRPATEVHLAAWVDQFDVTFPVVLDPVFLMGAFGPAEASPLNVVVDLSTMVILRKISGNQRDTLERFIEEELERRASP